jgi:alanyl-tRNA synthetase
MKAADIRRTFLDYFAAQGHEVVPSAPLVPRHDPTLLFVNSGMVPFKDAFTGQEGRANPRATSCQKSIRAGGKHNDLDQVGYTTRHHTFFEMLGNFSFGDYFKEQAIAYAWELITKHYQLPTDRLLVTVYHDDDEAASLWSKIAGFPESKIIRIATSDNFWSMGDTGPCGPSSEIFIDCGEQFAGGPPGSANQDGDRFKEIWNLVFMQYEQLADGRRIALPKPSIDTGMGFERLVSVLQGSYDNFATDLIRPLIEASAGLSNTDPDGVHRFGHRVIADHLRATCFLIADGVLPSNEGRGYVLRRIIRRALRHGHQLGLHEPFLYRLVPNLNSIMGDAYPELLRAETLIAETILLEEKRFLEMLGRGLHLLAEETSKLSHGGTLDGAIAFKLYDTFGFPLDLTTDVLREKGLAVDHPGFDSAMAAQKAAARKAWVGSGDSKASTLWFDLKQRYGASEFLGYSTEVAAGQLLAIVQDGVEVTTLAAGQGGELLFNQTPFYAESGGQQGDIGLATTATGQAQVQDTKKLIDGLHVHRVQVVTGTLTVGQEARLQVAGDHRGGLRAHHSATHLLHESLRRRLGDHVTQKGSLVAPDFLRFDFSHPKPLSVEEVQAIEDDVNAQVRRNLPTVTQLMTPQAAITAGAMALFGEKYGDEVRVVSMGGDEGGTRASYSTELCGGTHVRATGDIGLFKIIEETSVAAGIRRIKALTGKVAEDWVRDQLANLQQIAAKLKTAPPLAAARVESLLTEQQGLKQQLGQLRHQLLAGGGGAGIEAAGSAPSETINGIGFASRVFEDLPPAKLRAMADKMKQDLGSGIVLVATTAEGKVSLAVGVSDDLTQRFDAVTLVRQLVPIIGGQGGGGRPDMAQAGGSQVDCLDDALAEMRRALANAG